MDDADFDALSRRFERFARVECRDSSPLYERLTYAVAADRDLLVLAAHCRPGQPAPNLFLGAIHAHLLAGARHPLAAFYPSVTPNPDTTNDPAPAFRDFCLAHAEPIRALIESRRVQTNEVRRSAILLPALGLVAARAGRPLALVEVGASAGLLLLPDRYGFVYGDGRRVGDSTSPVQLGCEVRGDRPPLLPATVPPIAWRRGVDLHPIDARDAVAVAWLRALVWPEHAERAALLERACALAATDPPTVLAGDALDLLPDLLDAAPEDAALCVFHAHTLNQFPAEARARFVAILDARAADRDLYRISLGDYFLDPPEHSLLVMVTHESDARTEEVLAAYDPHGRWIEWRS